MHNHCTGDCASTHSGDSCGIDHCLNVEGNNYRSASDSLKVDAPTLTLLTNWCLSHATSLAMIELPLFASAGTSPPPELAPTWQFITRAAHPARAPNPVV